eukprot:353088-Chlamydomonas_euryale.AAC.3
MDGWVDGWMGGWMSGWMDGWMGGCMDGWIDRWTEGIAARCRLYLAVLRPGVPLASNASCSSHAARSAGEDSSIVEGCWERGRGGGEGKEVKGGREGGGWEQGREKCEGGGSGGGMRGLLPAAARRGAPWSRCAAPRRAARAPCEVRGLAQTVVHRGATPRWLPG